MVGLHGRWNGPRKRVARLLGAFLLGLALIAGLGAAPAGALVVITPDIDVGRVCVGSTSAPGFGQLGFTTAGPPGGIPSLDPVSKPNNVGLTISTFSNPIGEIQATVTARVTLEPTNPLGPFALPVTIDSGYRAPDGGLETDRSTFDVVGTAVPDCNGPVVSVPGPITVAPTSPAGATATFTVTAKDNVDGDVPATCDHSSGSVFPIGTTKVTCTAADALGNKGSASFDVIVSKPTPPVFSALPVIPAVEATSPAGAVVTWTGPTAADAFGKPLVVNCEPASGDIFSIGTTSVRCSADDGFGQNIVSDPFFVTVTDSTAPVPRTQPPISVPASSPAGASVTYPAQTATDIVDGSIPATCTPPSGSVFPLGSTLVTCTATDKAGNAATNTFTVTVTNTAPELTVPADLAVEATGPGGAPATFAATATDNEDGTAPVACTPASGSTFALGTTTVDCTATDSGDLTDTGTFAVTVRDTTSPLVTVPANLSVPPTAANGAAVDWPAATASDLVSGSLPTTCTPASGATFAAGTTTTVTCSATDAAGNTGSASFTVTVGAFTFKGFFDDLKACKPGVVVCNTAKGGSREELEFRVFAGTTELKTTSVIRSVTQTPVSCTTGAATGPAQALATTGLEYERDDAKFEFKWTVPRTGTCWQVTVTNTSGSSLSAVVKLKS